MSNWQAEFRHRMRRFGGAYRSAANEPAVSIKMRVGLLPSRASPQSEEKGPDPLNFSTMIYTHVLNRGGHGVDGSADRL